MQTQSPARDERKCLECGEALRGRSDQKFCSDMCRNAYNNKLNSDVNNLVRNTNNILRKNRRILIKLNPEGKKKIHKDQLAKEGFNFDYFTSIYQTNTGNTYFMVYEEGYLPIEDDYFVLIRKK